MQIDYDKRIRQLFIEHLPENDGQVLFDYSGPVTQEWIADAAEKLKKDSENLIKNSFCFGIFVELTQNILRYGLKSVNPSDSSRLSSEGHLRIGLNQDRIWMVSGNLIDSDRTRQFSGYLDEVFSKSSEELARMYRSRLHAEGDLQGNSAGLGLLDIGRKSFRPPVCRFIPAGSNQDLFIFSIVLKKDNI